MKKVILSAMLAIAGLASFSAQAVTVSFNSTNTNVAGGDQSGKTSPYLDAANVAKGTVFVETFDHPAAGSAVTSQGCGIDTPSNLVSITGGSYGTRKGTVAGAAAAPSGDSTCFAYGPAIGGALPDTVTLDYTGLINSLGGKTLNYLGLYYGSIDTYNDLMFYDANGDLIQTITGQSLIDLFNGTSGDQTSSASNIYVNLLFTDAEAFTSFKFTTRAIAFEMDNVAVGYNVSAIPEPGSIGLLGLGLAALGVNRRRSKAKKA
ncbi:hypothetical protein RD110_19250 [Rhodoferax koreense]|uniref:Ice-binding protein C-terminal domain-containing protein n=1 Tax=Rhodoferax koreensis TaxID=1842727 RepID=A0A1P8JZ99_9BURK|nr:PEP-CTERM sorting domain-containing protein [Rhodoferax koreense]APW39082.1 hypothetical protein RD110_19250 [Rhodoferax koreense]